MSSSMTHDQATTFLTGHFDQLAAGLAHRDPAAMADVVRDIRDAGFPDVADVVLEGASTALHDCTGQQGGSGA